MHLINGLSSYVSEGENLGKLKSQKGLKAK